ncbi:hypothetical protein ACHAW5_006131 [Stephanodiscus triporus]|uniref:Uncharacterized protein n=1 Tax=Stephanodiscus triporus TaxID=2934178 RepID=A0ABD3MIB8_9STRA
MQSNQSRTAAAGTKRERGGEVEVVVCPSAFPDFTTVGGSTSRRRERSRRELDVAGERLRRRQRSADDGKGDRPELDVQETIREVHKFGAGGFTGARKRSHQNAEYEKLTGRTAKRQKIPTKILVGMRQKAMKREERQKREERESGVVGHSTTTTTTTTTKKKKKRDKRPSDDVRAGAGPRGVFGSNRARNTGDRRKMSSRSFGPSPDVGFMLRGILKVKHPGGR